MRSIRDQLLALTVTYVASLLLVLTFIIGDNWWVRAFAITVQLAATVNAFIVLAGISIRPFLSLSKRPKK